MRPYTVLGTLVLVIVFTLTVLKFNYHYIYNYGKNETNMSNITKSSISQATKNLWKVLTNSSESSKTSEDSESDTGGDKSDITVEINSIDGGVTSYKSCKVIGGDVVCQPICTIYKVTFEMTKGIEITDVYVGTEDGSKKITDCEKIGENEEYIKMECNGEIDNLDSGTKICVFINGEKKVCVGLAGPDGCSYS